MNAERVEVFKQSFAKLTEAQRANLRWHAERGTPICCGPKVWILFADGSGAG